MILNEKQKELRNLKIRENKEIKIIDELVDKVVSTSENSLDLLDLVAFANDDTPKDNQLQNSSVNSIRETVYREAVELEFSVVPFERPINHCNTFNQLEEIRLKELISAMAILQTPSSHNIRKTEDFWEALRLLNTKCDLEIRKIIKMAKKLRAFGSLDENDKIILLKYSVIEIMSLRMTEYFDLNGQHWRVIIVSIVSNRI